MNMIVDIKSNVYDFIEGQPFIKSNIINLFKKISEVFTNETFTLEINEYDELPELWLVVNTEKGADEAIDLTKKFDKWFVPNFYVNTERFNYNINFK